MGSFDEVIRTIAEIADMQNSIARGLDISGFNRALDSVRISDSVRQMMETTNVMREYMESIQLTQQLLRPVGGYEELQQTLDVMRSSVNLPTGFVESINSMVASTIDVSSITRAAAQLSDSMLPQREMIKNFQSALNSSLAGIELNPSDYSDMVITDDIWEAVEDIGNGSATKDNIENKDISWKKRVKAIICWILLAICSSFISYVSEPVFQVLCPLNLLQEKDKNSEIIAEIPKDTEVTVWSSDLSQDYIEVSFKDGDAYKQGYIDKKDIQENAIQISEGHQLDEIVFTNICVELMADYWKIEPDETYNRLCMETNLMNDYIIPNYCVLRDISEADLIKEIDEHYCDMKVQTTESVD